MTTNIRLTVLALVIMLTAACGSNPASPTVVQPQTVKTAYMDYAINVPAANIAQQLNAQFPNGVMQSPVASQAQWDFTSTYHAPNVYYGDLAPQPGQYALTGIVVAPRLVAAMNTFTSTDWPNIGLEPGTVYTWRGTFAYAQPR